MSTRERAYEELTTRVQSRHMYRLASRAVAAYELDVSKIERFAVSFNQLYRVRATQGLFVLRVGPGKRIHPLGSATAEQRWTATLGRLLAPQVLSTRAGAAAVMVEDERVPARRECMLLSWVPGRRVRRPVSARDVRDLAALAASLHESSPPVPECPPGVLDACSWPLFEIPDQLPSAFASAREAARRALDRLAHSAEVPRQLHGDLTPANVVRNRDGLAAVDFQDAMWGYVSQDLANTIYALGRDDRDGRIVACFLDEYRTRRRSTLPDFSLLPDLLMARRLTVANLSIVMGAPPEEVTARHLNALVAYERSHDS